MVRLTYTRLLAVSVCAAALWMGASTIAATTASADDGPSSAKTTSESSAEPSSSTYTVQPGDYLDAIAKEHNINWPSIYEKNEAISNPDLIYPKQELTIPAEDIPLTRSINGVNLPISQSYAPQPSSPTQSAPSSQRVNGATGYSAQQSPTYQGASGVPGLSQVIGRPYIHGGTSLAGFDCSGLTQYLAALRGIQLPRTVVSQYQATARIGLADLRPGDLVFFNANHVGMYIGGNQIVHAANPSLGVRIDNLQVAIQYNGYWGAGALGR